MVEESLDTPQVYLPLRHLIFLSNSPRFLQSPCTRSFFVCTCCRSDPESYIRRGVRLSRLLLEIKTEIYKGLFHFPFPLPWSQIDQILLDEGEWTIKINCVVLSSFASRTLVMGEKFQVFVNYLHGDLCFFLQIKLRSF